MTASTDVPIRWRHVVFGLLGGLTFGFWPLVTWQYVPPNLLIMVLAFFGLALVPMPTGEHRWGAFAGFVVGLAWVLWVFSSLGRSIGWSEYDLTFVGYWIVLVVGSVIAGIAAWTRARIDRRGRDGLRSAGGATVVLAGVGAMTGAVALATTIVLLFVPAGSSFAVETPAGWTDAGPQPFSYSFVQGRDLYLVDGDPGPDGAASSVGVTVGTVDRVGAATSLNECFTRSLGPQLRQLGRPEDVTLAAGTARHATQDLDPGRVDWFVLSRDRAITVFRAPLCYLVAVADRGNALTTADVNALMASFRFR